jgi:DNA-binding XRE family transcriptional regulator
VAVETLIQDGRERVILDRAEYEDLVDARDHAIAMRDIAAGEGALTSLEMADYLAAPTPLAFWRKRSGKTQAEMAAEAGVSQPFMTQIEAGTRVGAVGVLARIAQALGVWINDLVEATEVAPEIRTGG